MQAHSHSAFCLCPLPGFGSFSRAFRDESRPLLVRVDAGAWSIPWTRIDQALGPSRVYLRPANANRRYTCSLDAIRPYTCSLHANRRYTYRTFPGREYTRDSALWTWPHHKMLCRMHTSTAPWSFCLDTRLRYLSFQSLYECRVSSYACAYVSVRVARAHVIELARLGSSETEAERDLVIPARCSRVSMFCE